MQRDEGAYSNRFLHIASLDKPYEVEERIGQVATTPTKAVIYALVPRCTRFIGKNKKGPTETTEGQSSFMYKRNVTKVWHFTTHFVPHEVNAEITNRIEKPLVRMQSQGVECGIWGYGPSKGKQRRRKKNEESCRSRAEIE